MTITGRRFIYIALACALVGLPAGAQTPDRVVAEATKRKDTAKRRKAEAEALRKAKAAKVKLAKELAVLARERGRLKQRLIESAAIIQKAEGRLTAIEARLGELNAQHRLIAGSLARRRDTIAELLAALQRMGRNPPPVMMTQRSDALALVRSAMLVATVFPEMREKALTLAAQLQELDRVLVNIRAKTERRRQELARLVAERKRLNGLLAARNEALKVRRGQLAEVQRLVKRYARNVDDLGAVLNRLDKVLAAKTTLGEYERERRAKTAATGAATGETSGMATAPSAEWLPSGTKLALANPARIKPQIPFSRAKGRLLLPVTGVRRRRFGERSRRGARSAGIAIETRRHAQVVAPSDGWIEFSGVFRSYGPLLIINGGEGYHILLAGMAKIDVVIGQFVVAGEPIGRMAGSGSLRSPKIDPQTRGPILYIEFQRKGRPLDPDPWWISGGEKVQG